MGACSSPMRSVSGAVPSKRTPLVLWMGTTEGLGLVSSSGTGLSTDAAALDWMFALD